MMSVATEQAVPESAAAVLTGPALDERICQFLVAKGRLKETDLVRGRRLHEEDPSGRLISLLTRLGLVSERDMADGAGRSHAAALAGGQGSAGSAAANVQLSVRFLKHHHVVPIGETESEVKLLSPIRRITIRSKPLPWPPANGIAQRRAASEIDDLIERYYGQGRSAMGTIVENLSDDNARSEDDVEHLRDLASEAPVIRLVNLVIQRAVEAARVRHPHRTVREAG
jgi:general secretion pathway protein E